MTSILKSPVRVYPDRMSVYFFNGDSCADIVSGMREQQAAVLALVGQAQRMALLLQRLDKSAGFEAASIVFQAEVKAVLRDAGLMSDLSGKVAP